MCSNCESHNSVWGKQMALLCPQQWHLKQFLPHCPHTSPWWLSYTAPWPVITFITSLLQTKDLNQGPVTPYLTNIQVVHVIVAEYLRRWRIERWQVGNFSCCMDSVLHVCIVIHELYFCDFTKLFICVWRFLCIYRLHINLFKQMILIQPLLLGISRLPLEQ